MRQRLLIPTFTAVLMAVPSSAWGWGSDTSAWLPGPFVDCEYGGMSVTSVNVTVDRRRVNVVGLATRSVHVTARVVQEPGPYQTMLTDERSKNDMLAVRYGRDAGTDALLRRVKVSGNTTVWEGDLVLTGPSRTISRLDVYAPTAMCANWPTQPPITPITYVSTNTPVLTVDRRRPADPRAKAYTISGRVRGTSGKPYGAAVRVMVSRLVDRGYGSKRETFVTRTNKAGHFSFSLPNRIDARRGAALAVSEHDVYVPSSFKEPTGDFAPLTSKSVEVPWRTSLPVSAPKTVKAGGQFMVRSSAPLPPYRLYEVQRLHGRTAWRHVASGESSQGGTIEVPVVASDPGPHVYRLRWWVPAGYHDQATSKPFTVTTVK